MKDHKSYISYCEQLAESLEDEEWKTSNYLRFRDAVQKAVRGGDATPELDALHSLFEGVRQTYGASSLMESEVTSETVAGHLLMTRGLEEWMEAVAMAREVDEEQLLDALDLAEQANRLLVAFQMLEAQLAEDHK